MAISLELEWEFFDEIVVPARASIWFEIPVTDMARSQAFYGAVLQNQPQLDETGPNPVAMFAADDKMASGHMYPGKPATPGHWPHYGDVRALRAALALDHLAKVACPVTIGYHQRTVSEAAPEGLQD